MVNGVPVLIALGMLRAEMYLLVCHEAALASAVGEKSNREHFCFVKKHDAGYGPYAASAVPRRE